MKKISDLFTDEEKKQLSYLGFHASPGPSEEELMQQEIQEDLERGRKG
jgi:hypothetical protein